jgi:cytochrome c oxidase subunit 4
MARPTHSIKTYLAVYVALIALLCITVSFAFIDVGRHANNAIAIIIPCIKAVLIVLFFMHMKWEKWITWFFAAAGFIWLCIMISMTMTDYLTRNHPADSSPKGEPVFVSPD